MVTDKASKGDRGKNSDKLRKVSTKMTKTTRGDGQREKQRTTRRDNAQREGVQLLKRLEEALEAFPPNCSEDCESLKGDKSECNKEAGKEELVIFEQRYLVDLKNNTRTKMDRETLLHIIVNNWSKAAWSSKQKRFLSWMLQQQEFRSLLEKQDKKGFTPMHIALEEKLDEFVNCVLDAKGLRSIINILKTDSPKGNCLHLATESNFPYLLDMIHKCAGDSEVLLAKTRFEKNTPLHLAVGEVNILVVDKPLDSKPAQGSRGLLEKDYDTGSMQDDSVFGQVNINNHDFDEDLDDDSDYHPSDSQDDNVSEADSCGSNSTCDEQKVEGAEEVHTWRPETEEEQRCRLSRVLKDLDKETARPRPSLFSHTHNEGMVGQAEIHPESAITTNTTEDSISLPVGHSVHQLILACPEALEILNDAKRTPYQEREHVLLNDSLVKEVIEQYARENPEGKEDLTREEVEAREKRAKRMVIVKDPVAHYIRSFCLRHLKSREVAMSRLYKPGQECHIEFDLAGMPNTTIPQAYLNQLEMHLKFESILKYVAIPALSIKPQASRKVKRTLQSTKTPLARAGRSDLIAIFDWLWRNGVREVIKVMVVDDKEQPHSDAAIVEALYGFKVEEWDWKRVDLCSDVICQASPNIREVSLYSSGNNAVLMGWASDEGLGNRRKFPKLEKVNIFIRDGLEDSDAREKYSKNCKSKIMEHGGIGPNGKKIEVNIIPDKNKVSFSSEFHNVTSGKSPSWIESIQSFASFLKIASDDSGKAMPVKIAIIDDGIDATVASLQSKVAGGATFCPYPHSSEFVNSYFVPSGKHGTLMAQLICRLCPNVQLYIARLEELPTPTGIGRCITARSAAKAVDWAINCGVDIISMSWTIQTTEPETSDMRKLKDAIDRAHTARILMFCSASDQGGHAPGRSFPGDWNQCIRIGGATFAGDKLTWVDDKVDFWFPGRDVPFPSDDEKTIVYESGSSVATAAASGLAAVLIYAAQLVKGDEDNYNVFRGRDALQHAFRSMASGTDRKFPRTSEILGTAFKEKLRKEKKRQGGVSEVGKRAFSVDIETLRWDKISRKALEDLLLDFQT